jgi:catechol 2,3-dioxygenase-like lactoylglutathione lyase family enzyme
MTVTPVLASNLAAARRFYAAAAHTLGLDLLDWRNGFIIGDPQVDEPVVQVRGPDIAPAEAWPAPSEPITFSARDDYSVRAFYRAALEAGGREVGYPAPQATNDGQRYYAAKVRDPDGNLIECGWRH